MFEDFATIGAWGFLTTGAVLVGAAPPTDAGGVVTATDPPAETPPVVARADTGVRAKTSMANSVEPTALNRKATSFVGLRG